MIRHNLDDPSDLTVFSMHLQFTVCLMPLAVEIEKDNNFRRTLSKIFSGRTLALLYSIFLQMIFSIRAL